MLSGLIIVTIVIVKYSFTIVMFPFGIFGMQGDVLAKTVKTNNYAPTKSIKLGLS